MKLEKIVSVTVAVLGITACGGISDGNETNRKVEASDASLEVVVLLAPSGKGDNSYNDASLSGLELVSQTSEISVKSREIGAVRADEFSDTIRRLAIQEPDLIVGVGFLYADPFQHAAQNFPNQYFLLLDANLGESPNVRSATFREDEGSFLAGVAAAAETKTGSIGFVGGMDIPIINSFECGYKTGAEWASSELNKAVSIRSVYIGNTADAFSNPSRARELTKALLANADVDVVYHAAGASGNGVIEAADESEVWAIGVDIDQSFLAPETVLTSMRKRLDLAVSNTIKDISSGDFHGGELSFDVRSQGVDVVQPGKMTDETLELMDLAVAGVSNGKLPPCQN